MKEKKQSNLSLLLNYAGRYRGLTYLGMGLSAVAMVLGMLPYIYVWRILKELIEVAPNWQEASGVIHYGWMAFWLSIIGIIVYFIALMCTHIAAFRTASNIRKAGMSHLMKAPLGYFDSHASGLLRNRIDAGASDTETLLAHNLADIVGSIVMFFGMIVIMFLFDWRMGLACLLAAVISIAALSTMMTGQNASFMTQTQTAQDEMSKAGTEYVRGIPVVKVFQQTVYSFRAFKECIEKYSKVSEHYAGDICSKPQSFNLTATEGAFIFLVPMALFLAPRAIASGDFMTFITDFAFYAIFSAIISTALARIMFAVNGVMIANSAVKRFSSIMNAPTLAVSNTSFVPKDNSIEFKNVTFTYEGSTMPAISNVSFRVKPGETVALVGPSGGGKTTAASMIPRFWDPDEGTIKIGGVDVKEMDSHYLMNQIAFVFQNDHLFKMSILDNVRLSRPTATREEVLQALHVAQCDDIIEKLPDGLDTVIGTEGTYLSGGEQQRVSLARAILKDAPIIFLDEATAFADPENEVQIQKALKSLMKNKTVIMIAHRLSTVTGANRIIVLREGHVVEQGSHEELVKTQGVYSHMWEEYHQAITWQIKAEGVS